MNAKREFGAMKPAVKLLNNYLNESNDILIENNKIGEYKLKSQNNMQGLKSQNTFNIKQNKLQLYVDEMNKNEESFIHIMHITEIRINDGELLKNFLKNYSLIHINDAILKNTLLAGGTV